jgi:hypothetical protein
VITPRRSRTRRSVVALAVALLLMATLGCGDGTPGFCEPLRDNADLGELGSALDEGDLDVASAEAQRLNDLAKEAPVEIRADLEALADAVVQIVDLLADDVEGSTDAGDLERRREQLNDELAELDQRSERVSTWALEECGLRLD